MVSAVLAIAICIASQDPSSTPSADCRDWSECRQMAVDAVARKEYEAAHDFAWRAVQKGPQNDPALLLLLARAQSLSGRPHDALVMLRRIAGSGVAAEAVASEEFARVRALSGWGEVEALLKAGADVVDVVRPNAAGGAIRPKANATPSRPPPDRTGDVAFDAASFKPAALAYDRVSRRFIIADADVSRLAVVDEFSRQMATLASGGFDSFGVVTAIEIEPRAGNLWVASVDGGRASLHKLQLISARVLKGFPAAEGRFSDIAVSDEGVVFALDGVSGAILRLTPASASPQRAATIAQPRPASIAPAGQTVYVAHARGIDRLSPGGSIATVPVPDTVDAARIQKMRWSRGALVALQAADDGAYRLVRIRLNREGTAVAAVDVLDADVRTPAASAMTVVGDVVYYLAQGEGGALVIRRRPTS